MKEEKANKKIKIKKQLKSTIMKKSLNTLLIIGSTVLTLLISSPTASAQNVSIAPTPTPPAGDAGLDINFTDRGLLIPRVSLSNTETYGLVGGGPTTSMLVYNTNAGITGTGAAGEGFYYWNGTRWTKLQDANTSTSATNAWLTTGNAGTDAGTHFVGTTDNVSLNFRVNNTQAGHIGIFGDNSVFLGLQAGFNNAPYNRKNTFIGTQAGYSNTTGDNNTASGYQSFYNNTTGFWNTASGVNALYSNTTGYFNSASGARALYSNTAGIENTASGYQALYYNTTGDKNAALGYRAGHGASGVDFNQCTFVGSETSPSVARTNVTMLGYGIYDGQCTGDNQVLLGNTAVTQIRAQVGSITTYSDKRFKTNIAEDVKGLDFITRLRPVSFNENPEILHQIWGTPDSLVKNIDHSQIKNTRFVGLIAQEVEQAMKESGYTHFPGIDIPRNEHEVYSLRYTDFIMPLIKSVQELNQKLNEENTKLKAELYELKAELDKFTTQNTELKSQLDKFTTMNEQLTKNVSHLKIQNTELKSRIERIEQILGTTAAKNK